MKILSLAMVLLLAAAAFAQKASTTESPSEKEKARKELEERVLKMLDQAVGDAQYLRLAQNRAIVYAIAGDLYWKFDEKSARALFRNSANEIIAANAESEKESKESDDPYFSMFEDNNIRNEILPLIAKHDADLALELLVETRPAKLAAELAKALQPNAKQEIGYFEFDPAQYRVRNEIALEQRFAVLAAEQNPEKSVKLIKESLAKGISWNVMPLLQKLNQKDEKKAAELADEIIKKIADSDLTKKRDDLGAAINFLQYATNPNAPQNSNPKEKPFKFSDAQLRDLANKLANTFLQPSNSLDITMSMVRAMPGLEKIVPDKVPLLKLKHAETMKNLPPEVKRLEQQQKLWNPNSTPEEILADLPKLNEYERASAFHSLAEKISQIEDEARAKKIIEQIPDEKARERASEQYESAKINRAAKAGKLDEAKKMIGNLSKRKTQIFQLVALAIEFHKKETKEDRETAAGLMKDARALLGEYTEDEDDLNDAMEIVKGYSQVNPDEAFRIFEPIVDQLNEYIQASAVLSKFNKRSRTFKKSEIIMKVNGYSWDGLLLFRYINQIQMLGKADLNRMSLFADKFQRNDVRTIVKLFISQGFLRDEKKEASGTSGGGVIIFY